MGSCPPRGETNLIAKVGKGIISSYIMGKKNTSGVGKMVVLDISYNVLWQSKT
jgi:hypothetical protein